MLTHPDFLDGLEQELRLRGVAFSRGGLQEFAEAGSARTRAGAAGSCP
jgi:hypothetical protein